MKAGAAMPSFRFQRKNDDSANLSRRQNAATDRPLAP
jgi:hypothetical protein